MSSLANRRRSGSSTPLSVYLALYRPETKEDRVNGLNRWHKVDKCVNAIIMLFGANYLYRPSKHSPFGIAGIESGFYVGVL